MNARQYLKLKGLIIKDENNNLVIKQATHNPEPYIPPHLIVGLNTVKAVFGKATRQYIQMSLNDLHSRGWKIWKILIYIYGRNIRKKIKPFYKGHKFFVFPYPSSGQLPWQYNASSEVTKLTSGLRICYDLKTRRFRLEGQDTGIMAIGEWKHFDRDSEKKGKRKRIKKKFLEVE